MLQNQIDGDVQYANWLKQVALMLSPKDLYLILGRASGKTTDFMAERAQDIVHDMPGAFFAFAADTYLNAQKNIVPTIAEGWERLGWHEGMHYVIDQRPPTNFDHPYKRVINWKHTITTWNGCHFKIVSMDRPSGGAGDSYQHIFGDEAKYLEQKKINKLIPAIRGEYPRFGHSVYYRGRTFTTDMPNVAHGENDWILDMAKLMDPDQITAILKTAWHLNMLRILYYSIKELLRKGLKPEDGFPNWPENIQNLYFYLQENGIASPRALETQIADWEKNWKAIRKNSTFFYVASSFINANILTLDFYKDSLSSLGWQEFKTSVLSIKSNIRKGDSFYPQLTPDHFFKNGINYNHYDKLGLKDTLVEDSNGLRFVDPNRPLSAGCDVGNYLWLLIGQEDGIKDRILKEFYTAPPDYIRELADEFIEFFKPHKKKVLFLYHDRSANQYRKVGRDVISEIKHDIEYHKDGTPTGWLVRVMNENQGIITQLEEYDFMQELLGGGNKNLPTVEIDFYNCKALKSSLENTPVKVTKRKGRTFIEKDKSSEKRYADRPEMMPYMSTNFSDAFKYYFCRRTYMAMAGHSRKLSFSDPKIRG